MLLSDIKVSSKVEAASFERSSIFIDEVIMLLDETMTDLASLNSKSIAHVDVP